MWDAQCLLANPLKGSQGLPGTWKCHKSTGSQSIGLVSLRHCTGKSGEARTQARSLAAPVEAAMRLGGTKRLDYSPHLGR